MTTALVLSGGGFRGLAHVGVIRALEEFDLVPDIISGTSAGAIVGALYAKGYSSDIMLKFFEEIQLFSIQNYARGKPGWVDSEKFNAYFLEYFPDNDFNSLQKKLFVTAVNLLNGNLHIIEDGPLVPALMASAAFPGIIAPVQMNSGYFVDGGVLNNFPVEPVLWANRIIGSSVNGFEQLDSNGFQTSFQVLERVFKIMTSHESRIKFSKCNLMFEIPNLEAYQTFRQKDLTKLVKIGYDFASEVLKGQVPFLK